MTGFIQRNPCQPKAMWWKKNEISTEIDLNDSNNTIKIDKFIYIKQFAFDVSKENDQQISGYQPIQGLLVDSDYITLKTFNFNNATMETPKKSDILQYQGGFWIIEEIRKTFVYRPREQAILHISLKRIKK